MRRRKRKKETARKEMNTIRLSVSVKLQGVCLRWSGVMNGSLNRLAWPSKVDSGALLDRAEKPERQRKKASLSHIGWEIRRDPDLK